MNSGNDVVQLRPERRGWLSWPRGRWFAGSGEPRVRWWSAFRALLLVLWIVGAAASWWTAPREGSLDQARADIAAGRVTSYQWGDSWQGSARRWFAASELEYTGVDGPLFVWRTDYGRVHWFDTAALDGPAAVDAVDPAGAVDTSAFSGSGAAALAQDLLDAGLADRMGNAAQPIWWIGGLGLALGVTFFAVLAAGPAPVRGTRWFWFWLVVMSPWGLGFVFWMMRDRPWCRLPAEPGNERRRDRGYLGFAVGVLGSIAISLVLLGLGRVLGDWWIPTT